MFMADFSKLKINYASGELKKIPRATPQQVEAIISADESARGAIGGQQEAPHIHDSGLAGPSRPGQTPTAPGSPAAKLEL
jgi:hypothetical protein